MRFGEDEEVRCRGRRQSTQLQTGRWRFVWTESLAGSGWAYRGMEDGMGGLGVEEVMKVEESRSGVGNSQGNARSRIRGGMRR